MEFKCGALSPPSSMSLISAERLTLSFPFHIHLCPGLHAAAKIVAFRVLRKIVSLTIFCVARDFSLFFVMLITTKPEQVAGLNKICENCEKSLD